MPTDHPHKIDYDCDQCGAATAVNMRTGLLDRHRDPQARTPCPASGSAIVDPDESLGPVPAHHHPDAILHYCPDCGRRTKINRRTGLRYSHTLPDSLVICPASNSPAMAPTGGEPPRIEPENKPEQETTRSRARLANRSGMSVRAIFNGGLPGHGRRR